MTTIPITGCPKCGRHTAVLGPGKGPHAARLDCQRCRRFIKWVGKADLDNLTNDLLADALNRAGGL